MSSDARRTRSPTLVLLDANALFLPFRHRVDLVAEVERILPGASLVVPSSVRRELEALIGREVPAARAALQLADQLPTIHMAGRGDDAIVALARVEGAAVVTGDRDLRDRLVRLGLHVLVPRDRSRLELFHRRARAATVKNRAPLSRRPR